MFSMIIRATALSWFAAIAISLCSAAERTIPKPLPDHPGNIFLAGEEVGVVLPNAVKEWRVLNYEGNEVQQGHGAGRIQLGRLPVGYYEVRCEGGDPAGNRPLSIGVLAPLAAPTPETSPVACDVGMGWSYPEGDMPKAANLCKLAGLNWVRDRFSWSEMEKEPGKLPDKSRYDVSADVQAAAGLKVLQVNHSVPPWVWAWSHDQRGRFPPDLRDAYNFYRRIAERWRGKIPAVEPWNEADAWDFGNHTGCEIATMQKASYLGLKAGNPSVIACQNAFAALRRPTTLGDFHANRAWPYFDTFNYHTYDPLCNYPAMGAAFRGVSAGRPMWLTEVNQPLKYPKGNKFKEPSGENMRIQAERLTKIYALSFHEGSNLTFFFFLPDYGNEYQFGLLRPDFTPRPGYLALAAVGRLLADARPLGRLRGATAGLSSSGEGKIGGNTAGQASSGTQNLQIFAFSAKPDGRSRTVLVAWSDDKTATLKLPVEPIAVYDNIGRESPKSPATVITLSSEPLTIVLAEDDAAKLAVDPPPAKPGWLEGKPSPIVMQVLLPKKRVDLEKSAYRIARGKADRVPIFVYNFGAEPADVRLSLKGPESWKPSLAESVGVAPGKRVQLTLSLDVPQSADAVETIAVEADCGPAGKAVLSMRFLPE